jgi:DNA-nicking Smr family endonuclease
MRRPRHLTAEEAEEWRRFTRSARKLHARAEIGRAAPAPEPEKPKPPVDLSPLKALPPAPPAPPRPAQPLAIGHHPPGVDNTRWKGLAQGAMRPERRLDLHGMTAAVAHDRLRHFIAHAHADGLRVVEVVTGTGGGSGVIFREFPHWLNAPELRVKVLAAAHPHRANAGAVRLLLRRRK